MSFYEELFGPSSAQNQMWLAGAEGRQALLAATTSNKSLSELQQMLKDCEAQIAPLNEQQKIIVEVWCCAVGRIKEKPFVEFYMLKCGPCQLLSFAEDYLLSSSGPVISTDIQQQYYYEEKLEVLKNIIEHGPDYLQNYQNMMQSLCSFIAKEAKSSTWERWDNDYVVRKMIRWIREWKGQFLL